MAAFILSTIYERFLHVMQESLNSQDISEQQLIKKEREIKSFIREQTNLELDDIDVLTVDWNGKQGEQIVAQIYEQAYAIWEVM